MTMDRNSQRIHDLWLAGDEEEGRKALSEMIDEELKGAEEPNTMRSRIADILGGDIWALTTDFTDPPQLSPRQHVRRLCDGAAYYTPPTRSRKPDDAELTRLLMTYRENGLALVYKNRLRESLYLLIDYYAPRSAYKAGIRDRAEELADLMKKRLENNEKRDGALLADWKAEWGRTVSSYVWNMGMGGKGILRAMLLDAYASPDLISLSDYESNPDEPDSAPLPMPAALRATASPIQSFLRVSGLVSRLSLLGDEMVGSAVVVGITKVELSAKHGQLWRAYLALKPAEYDQLDVVLGQIARKMRMSLDQLNDECYAFVLAHPKLDEILALTDFDRQPNGGSEESKAAAIHSRLRKKNFFWGNARQELVSMLEPLGDEMVGQTITIDKEIRLTEQHRGVWRAYLALNREQHDLIDSSLEEMSTQIGVPFGTLKREIAQCFAFLLAHPKLDEILQLMVPNRETRHTSTTENQKKVAAMRGLFEKPRGRDEFRQLIEIWVARHGNA